MKINQELYLPSPFKCFKRLYEISITKEFWNNIIATATRVKIGLTLSLFIGFSLGYLSHKISFVKDFFSPFISSLRSIPVVSFILLFILIFKSNNVPIIVCLVICMPIAYTNIYEGLNKLDYELIEMGKVFKLSNYKILTKIIYPMIKPNIVTATILCIGFSWKTIVVAEVLAVPLNSIGYELASSKTYLDTVSLFAWTIAIIILSFLMELFAKVLLRYKRVKND